MTASTLDRPADGSPVRPVRRRVVRGRVTVDYLTYVVEPFRVQHPSVRRPLSVDVTVDVLNVASAVVSVPSTKEVFEADVCKAHRRYAEGLTQHEHWANIRAERERPDAPILRLL